MSQQPAPNEPLATNALPLHDEEEVKNQNPPSDGQDKKPATPPKKVFTLNDVKRVIEIPIHWPALYPEFEPWVFKLRLALSSDAEKQRQEWLAIPEAEANEPTRFRKEILAQICDLLVDIPSGFGDLKIQAMQSPSLVFKSWVEGITDPEQATTIHRILEAAWNSYWARMMPQSFRPKAADSDKKVSTIPS